jgi:hypothetical protein
MRHRRTNAAVGSPTVLWNCSANAARDMCGRAAMRSIVRERAGACWTLDSTRCRRGSRNTVIRPAARPPASSSRATISRASSAGRLSSSSSSSSGALACACNNTPGRARKRRRRSLRLRTVPNPCGMTATLRADWAGGTLLFGHRPRLSRADIDPQIRWRRIGSAIPPHLPLLTAEVRVRPDGRAFPRVDDSLCRRGASAEARASATAVEDAALQRDAASIRATAGQTARLSARKPVSV